MNKSTTVYNNKRDNTYHNNDYLINLKVKSSVFKDDRDCWPMLIFQKLLGN